MFYKFGYVLGITENHAIKKLKSLLLYYRILILMEWPSLAMGMGLSE